MGTLWNGFEKYAIVGDDRWLELWVGIADPITPQHIKHFRSDDADAAWTWLTAPATSESAAPSEA